MADKVRLPPKTVRTARARAGGVARKRALTREQRQALASHAARARWAKASAALRAEAARKAVLARWAKVKIRRRSKHV